MSALIMNPFKAVTLPQYLFNPRQIVVRLQRATRLPQEKECVTLPWGGRLWVRPYDVIGAGLWFYGIFDLLVAETIARLLDAGETGLDIGANIGQMTRLMRVCAGPQGRVLAFEPQPEIFGELQANQAPDLTGPGSAPVELHQKALGERSGTATLDMSAHWESNRGMSKILESAAAQSGRLVEVPITTLDEVLGETASVGVMKLDVEGYEAKVLQGARKFLGRRIRDIIFEDFGDFPSPVHQQLQEYGYTIFGLCQRLWRPDLMPAETPGTEYLATLDAARAQERFQAAGWRVLRRRIRA